MRIASAAAAAQCGEPSGQLQRGNCCECLDCGAAPATTSQSQCVTDWPMGDLLQASARPNAAAGRAHSCRRARSYAALPWRLARLGAPLLGGRTACHWSVAVRVRVVCLRQPKAGSAGASCFRSSAQRATTTRGQSDSTLSPSCVLRRVSLSGRLEAARMVSDRLATCGEIRDTRSGLMPRFSLHSNSVR